MSVSGNIFGWSTQIYKENKRHLYAIPASTCSDRTNREPECLPSGSRSDVDAASTRTALSPGTNDSVLPPPLSPTVFPKETRDNSGSFGSSIRTPVADLRPTFVTFTCNHGLVGYVEECNVTVVTACVIFGISKQIVVSVFG